MYLTPTSLHWACDIEADNYLDLATTIWCITVVNIVTKEKVSFTDADSFNNWYHPSYILVGHNFLAYDLPMLNRHYGTHIPATSVVDTFVLSQLYEPTLGQHNLKNWGLRLGYPKAEFNDFSHYSPEMLRYCFRDAMLAGLLYVRLSERMRNVGFTELGCEIEHLAWSLIQNKQRKNGFPFDKQRGEELYVTLRSREEELKDEIHKLWPPKLEVVRRYKSGGHSLWISSFNSSSLDLRVT